MLPFVIRALKKLGPDTYQLTIFGSASATGHSDHNMDLSSRRATNVAYEIIRRFEEAQKSDAYLKGFQLEPVIITLGDTVSQGDPLLPALRSRRRPTVERSQAMFRAALFEFQAIEEPMPEVLERIKKLSKNPVVDFVIGKILKPFFDTIGGVLALATKQMVRYVVPKASDHCYEVKDSLSSHALYRYNAGAHQFGLGFMDLLSLLSALTGILKVLVAIAKHAGTAVGVLDKVTKLTDELIEKILGYVAQVAGPDVAAILRSAVVGGRDGLRPWFASLTLVGPTGRPSASTTLRPIMT